MDFEDSIEQVRAYYDEDAAHEWERMDRHPIEWAVNTHYIERYARPGDRVLDVGGGPGRYSIHLAQRGCDVTLADLSHGSVRHALAMARERGVSHVAVQADARDLSRFPDEAFDHVLLMGPLYHLLDEGDRIRAVGEAMRVLKPGGVLFAAFMNLYAGMFFGMARDPASILTKAEEDYMRRVMANEPYAGRSFTHLYCARPEDVLPLMERFPLEKLHLLGSEAMVGICEKGVLEHPKEVVDAWCRVALRFCEDERFISMSEHFLYIGRKL